MPLPTAERNKLKQAVKANQEPKRESLWKGPCSNEPNGGITFTMLSRFLVCRERFRIAYVEGIQPEPEYSAALEYGNMWHVCEQALAGTNHEDRRMVTPSRVEWEQPLTEYAAGLVRKYKLNGAEIDKAFRCCKVQFPIYVDYWRKHPDVKGRKPVFQEQPFEVAYKLPSGRVVILRGKFDAVDVIEKMLWVQENKSKSEPDREKLQQQLPFDLQSMMYLTALDAKLTDDSDPDKPGALFNYWKLPIGGIRYNVVRRPLSGQKYNIKQLKGRMKGKGANKVRVGVETKEQYYDRLGKLIKKEAHDFFIRMRMAVDPAELRSFQRRCLIPILEQLCDWWESIESDPFNPWQTKCASIDKVIYRNNDMHWFFPAGVYNPALEGRTSAIDQYILNKDMRGLVRIDELFPELKT